MSYTEFDELIPGMASYMEDTDVSVDVDVKEPEEVVEETTEAAENAAEAEAVEADAEANEEQVEMICRQFDELDRMEAHIQKYGVSREFVDWIGEKRMSTVCGIAIPSMESIDNTPNPSSQLSIAAMEGIGESIANAARAVWDFIVKVCRAVWTFMKRAYDFVVQFIIGTKRNAERLKKVWGERVDNPQRAAEQEATFATLAELTKAKEACGGKIVEKAFEVDTGIKKWIGSIFGRATDGTVDNSGSRKKLQEFQQMIDNCDKIIKGEIKAGDQAKKRKLSDCAWGDVPKLCDMAIQMTTDAKKMQNLVSIVQKEAQESMKQAEQKAKEAADPDRAKQKEVGKAGREAAKALSTMSRNLMKLLNFQRKVAAQCVKTASLRITGGSSKKGGQK